MKNILVKIAGFVVFFLYVSNIQFVFFPEKIRTRLIVSVVGFLYYFIRFRFSDNYRVLKVIKFIIPLAVWMALSMTFNMSEQYWFLQYVVLQILYAFGAVFVIRVGGLNNVTSLLWFFLVYVGIQDTIAFLSFQFPFVSEVLGAVQVSELSEDRLELLQLRSCGLGEFALFGGGVWVAIGLLCLTVLYKLGKIKLSIYVIVFVYLLGTGLFVARTALTGLFSTLILIVPFKKNWYKIALMALLGWIFMLGIKYGEQYFESLGLNTSYAFEIFDKYRINGKVQSNSYDATREMWQILPSDLKTWIIGDAMYEDVNGGYYMHTDVGYMRVIFYGGVVGLFFYLFYIYKLSVLAYKRSEENIIIKYFVAVYYILVLIWMWKGHYDTNCFLYLLLFSATLNQRVHNLKTIE